MTDEQYTTPHGQLVRRDVAIACRTGERVQLDVIRPTCWMYRSAIDRRYWHAWQDGVHTHWDAVVDDFGNLVLTH
jgi:hypothetical protein